MKKGIIVQARMGSTRLPGKILKPFYGDKTLIEVQLENLHKVTGAKVVVATTENNNNDELASFLKKQGELVFRGSENDVLDRFIKAAEEYEIDEIVRICSDNPFLDWHGVDKLFTVAENENADYIGFRINNSPSILTHFGFWGEYVKLSALKRVASSTPTGTTAHEHVTYHIYQHPDEYVCKWINCPEFLQGRNDIRLTIDTEADLVNAKFVYSSLKEKYEDFSIQEIVTFLDAHEKIKESMMVNISRNKK